MAVSRLRHDKHSGIDPGVGSLGIRACLGGWQSEFASGSLFQSPNHTQLSLVWEPVIFALRLACLIIDQLVLGVIPIDTKSFRSGIIIWRYSPSTLYHTCKIKNRHV